MNTQVGFIQDWKKMRTWELGMIYYSWFRGGGQEKLYGNCNPQIISEQLIQVYISPSVIMKKLATLYSFLPGDTVVVILYWCNIQRHKGRLRDQNLWCEIVESKNVYVHLNELPLSKELTLLTILTMKINIMYGHKD